MLARCADNILKKVSQMSIKYLLLKGQGRVKTLRAMDSAIEQEIAKYLDDNFYKNNVLDFNRYSDYGKQLKGIDVTFSYKDLKNVCVDEKAAAHYINKDIPTFAFEINFYTIGDKLVEGWLFADEKETEYYLLMWIRAIKDKHITKDDITELDCILISRKKIQGYLAQYGQTKEKLKEISRLSRQQNINGVFGKEVGKNYYYFLSQGLAEKPFNVIIKRNVLNNLAHSKFIVTSHA